MEIVAESFLSFGIEKVWDLLVRESGRITGVDEQLTELKKDLGYLRLFLKDADAKKHKNDLVKNCVEEIKEIAFDTEDIIETFLLRQELSGMKHRMRKLSWNIVDRRKVALEMNGISKRISKVITRMKSYDVQQMTIDVQRLEIKQREIRKTFHTSNEKNLVGLEENVKKLVGYLVEENNIQVVSIVGMGGLGKTTLARQVFNHEMVKNKFDRVAWVCISQEFSRKYVWQTIFQKLSSKDDDQRDSNMTEDELQEKLYQLLETSNSLIVLDDLWKEEDWDIIKEAFPSKKGWKILLTSRIEKVALHVDPTCIIFEPDYLSTEDSWTLFQMTAFPTENTSEYKVTEEMEEMGKQMIKHCGGLPLAVKVLGGLLAAQQTLTEWKRVFKHINSHIVGGISFNDRNINSVYHILHLSFEELPLYLKHCFLYLAHFPEDFRINVEELAYYWAADGISRPKYYIGATIRDVADGYIGELVQRNMIISEQDGSTSRFKTCRLHDMMREVCLRKAEDENFLQIVHSTSTTNLKLLCKSRRLAVHLYGETKIQVEKIKNPKLRSFLGIPNWFKSTEWMTSVLCFKQVQLMRVLDLSYAEFKGKKLPSSIGKLIHLRYLSLYRVNVSYLPSSMGNLKKLLYLNIDITSESPIYMSNFMKNMGELAYLLLPTIIDDKVKLELGNLVNLETLKNFSTKNISVKDLHQMTRLQALSIRYNGGCTMETLSSSLSELTQLENLEVYHVTKVAPRNNDEGFVLNCDHVKRLVLRIYMPKLPDEQNFISQLKNIILVDCCLKEDPMPILEKLLQLQEVTLYENSFCGRRMVCSAGGFPRLQKLRLDNLEEWEEWIVEEGSMPLLQSLTIWRCEKLKQLFDVLRVLEKLLQLKNVTLFNVPLSGRKWVCSRGGFPQLQNLLLFEVRDWEEWIVEKDSMPLLHDLIIWDCPKLKQLPDGMKFLTSLKALYIHFWKDLNMEKEWKEILSEGAKDYYKVQHIPRLEISTSNERAQRYAVQFAAYYFPCI